MKLSSSLLGLVAWAGSAVAEDLLFYQGFTYKEYKQALALNYTVHIASPDEWSAMTPADFANYKAIVVPDPNCGSLADIQFLTDSTAAWSPAVVGNIIVMGTDTTFHATTRDGAVALMQDGIRFAAAGNGTGLYFSLSCYYDAATFSTIAPLAPFGNFTAQGRLGCYDSAHVVATSPAFHSIDDANLSNWSCSAHALIPGYPTGGHRGFAPVAVLSDAVHDSNGSDAVGVRNFTAGVRGVPYIVARGAVPLGCGDGAVQTADGEQCDAGTQNGAADSLCSSTCQCVHGLDSTGASCASSSSASSSLEDGTAVSVTVTTTTATTTTTKLQVSTKYITVSSTTSSTVKTVNSSTSAANATSAATATPSSTAWWNSTTSVALSTGPASSPSVSSVSSLSIPFSNTTTVPFSTRAPSVPLSTAPSSSATHANSSSIHASRSASVNASSAAVPSSSTANTTHSISLSTGSSSSFLSTGPLSMSTGVSSTTASSAPFTNSSTAWHSSMPLSTTPVSSMTSANATALPTNTSSVAWSSYSYNASAYPTSSSISSAMSSISGSISMSMSSAASSFASGSSVASSSRNYSFSTTSRSTAWPTSASTSTPTTMNSTSLPTFSSTHVYNSTSIPTTTNSTSLPSFSSTYNSTFIPTTTGTTIPTSVSTSSFNSTSGPTSISTTPIPTSNATSSVPYTNSSAIATSSASDTSTGSVAPVSTTSSALSNSTWSTSPPTTTPSSSPTSSSSSSSATSSSSSAQCSEYIGIEIVIVVDIVEVCPRGSSHTITVTSEVETFTETMCITPVSSLQPSPTPCYGYGCRPPPHTTATLSATTTATTGASTAVPASDRTGHFGDFLGWFNRVPQGARTTSAAATGKAWTTEVTTVTRSVRRTDVMPTGPRVFERGLAAPTPTPVVPDAVDVVVPAVKERGMDSAGSADAVKSTAALRFGSASAVALYIAVAVCMALAGV